jgi:hypothetical protein
VDTIVDHPMLSCVRVICRLLRMAHSHSQVTGVRIKALESYPRTQQDIQRLGVQSLATNVSVDVVNRAVYAALRAWTGTIVDVVKSHGGRYLNTSNTWMLD